MGFDIVHLNLHKSFSQPHGGGGPGAGPIAVSDRIAPYLPVPRIVRAEGSNGSAPELRPRPRRPKSIGRLRGFQGNFGVFVRSYAYIRSLGGDGLAGRVRDRRAERQLPARAGCARAAPASTCRSRSTACCMHEFVLSGAPAKRELQVKTLDIAKRLLDYGFHPPTIYFPLLVDEALMFEPTETETRESLDELADAIESILAEAEEDPAILQAAPYTTPVRRLDEAAASRKPVVRQPRAQPRDTNAERQARRSRGVWRELVGRKRPGTPGCSGSSAPAAGAPVRWPAWRPGCSCWIFSI